MIVNIIENLMIIVIIVDMGVKGIVKVLKGSGEYMAEKRFVYYEHKGADYILDTPNESLDVIEMLGDCLEAEEIVDLLNQLSDENEEVKKENEFLKKRCDEYWEEAGLNSDYFE